MKNKFFVKGMHCKSCEILLKKEISSLNGVKSIDVSFKNGILEIDSAQIIQQETISKLIKKHGFSIEDKKYTNNKKNIYKITLRDYLEIILSTILVGIFIFVSYNFEIFKFFSNFGENITILTAILIGFIASISTCFALVGTIVISLSSIQNIDNNSNFFNRIYPHILFHIGRIIGFFFLGGLLGNFGALIQFSISFNGFFTIFIGIVMFYIGLQILRFVPNITNLGFYFPSFIAYKILKFEKINNGIVSFFIGVLTFFLPCGFTQSMQLLAIGSGNFLSGGIIMSCFALGTVPILLIAGIFGSFYKSIHFGLFQKIIGVIIIYFSIFSILNGYNLISGMFLNKNKISLENYNGFNQNNNIESQNNQYKRVVVYHNGGGIEGYYINLEQGKNYELIIVPKSNGIGCMATLVIPMIDKTIHKITKGVEIKYKLTNIQKGNYVIVCSSMGMIQGEIIVK